MTNREWLESLGAGDKSQYRWPHTPVQNLQAEIWRRVGASDLNLEHPDCRAGNILRTLTDMITNGVLPAAFTCLDICCGDAVILWHIQRCFGRSQCFGIDLNAGLYPLHAQAARAGVRLYPAALQDLVRQDAPERFDVAVMLNTYRGWEKADLPDEDSGLPALVDAWLWRNARYAIVTATHRQVVGLRGRGCGRSTSGAARATTAG